VKKQFHSIVAFSELEEFIDSPVIRMKTTDHINDMVTKKLGSTSSRRLILAKLA
jgi:ABC-type polysaccharide/polyol phosphate transport system ATPase subunit